MIDNITLVIHHPFFETSENHQGNIRIGKVTLIPVLCIKTGEVTKHQAFIKNLLFTLKQQVLIISNSVHKFFKGNNYSDFSFLELKKVIKVIQEITKVNPENIEVKKLEFALNINTKLKPHQYMKMFSDYKGKEFDKMRSKAFWYGNKYVLSEYALKIYDKSEMIKRTEGFNINKNILRFETQYSRARRIPNIETLKDLTNKDKIKGLFNELINQVNKLNCIGNEDFSIVTSRDREIYFAGQNSQFWDTEKKLGINTAKDKQKRYRKVQQKISKNNLIYEFVEQLKEKFNLLIEE